MHVLFLTSIEFQRMIFNVDRISAHKKKKFFQSTPELLSDTESAPFIIDEAMLISVSPEKLFNPTTIAGQVEDELHKLPVRIYLAIGSLFSVVWRGLRCDRWFRFWFHDPLKPEAEAALEQKLQSLKLKKFAQSLCVILFPILVGAGFIYVFENQELEDGTGVGSR